MTFFCSFFFLMYLNITLEKCDYPWFNLSNNLIGKITQELAHLGLISINMLVFIHRHRSRRALNLIHKFIKL